MRRNERGLTLIEVLVILLVIMTLAVIAIPPLLNARTRAEIARTQQDLQVVESAVEWFYMDNKTYPESTPPTALSNPGVWNRRGLLRLMEPVRYLDNLPSDRFQNTSLFGSSDLLYEFGSGGNRVVNGYRIEAWMLASRGPDGLPDTRHIDTFPMGTVAREYSPTNGLRSEGDILRYGGHYTEGNWFLNGRRISAGNQ